MLLVKRAATVDGVRYLKVLLKHQPAGSTGSIPAAKLRKTRTRVRIDLSRRTVTVTRRGRTLLRTRSVVGARRTPPPPPGLFAIDAAVRQPARLRLGRRVLARVSYSRTLTDFRGGTPQIAMHAYEQLGSPLGQAASNDCLRLPRRAVERLIALAPHGTPVLITR